MIFGKLWRAFKAQMNKMANFIWRADPIAQLQYEYDKLVDQLKEGRVGLEQYRALVEDAGLVIESEKVITFERDLEKWLSEFQSDSVDQSAVREMVEAGLETDAAGINARRQGNRLVFDQRVLYLRALKR